MADPINQNVALAGLLIGAGTSIGSGISQSMLYRSQASYQAKMAAINAELMKFQAEDALRRGENLAIEQKKQTKQRET